MCLHRTTHTHSGLGTPNVSPPAAMDSSLPTLSKDNDWLGFCPSAVKLQNGDRKVCATTIYALMSSQTCTDVEQGALKKRTDYVDHFSTSGISSYSCSAKGCAFQGHVSVDFAWKVVMKVKGLGLQCRWAFLGSYAECPARANLSFRQCRDQVRCVTLPFLAMSKSLRCCPTL